MKRWLKQRAPRPLRRALLRWKEAAQLRRVGPIACDAGRLAPLSSLHLDKIFDPKRTEAEWKGVEAELAALAITDDGKGVNPGDRRAIFHLIAHLRPRAVLEIGTHVGASTAHIAAAMRRSGAAPLRLVTADLLDVNDSPSSPWVKYGGAMSPANALPVLGCRDFVEFHARPSCSDFFPQGKRLWPDGELVPGPYSATERLRREGCPIAVLPFGSLPWPTKLGANYTSLALLGRA